MYIKALRNYGYLGELHVAFHAYFHTYIHTRIYIVHIVKLELEFGSPNSMSLQKNVIECYAERCASQRAMLLRTTYSNHNIY